MELEALAPGRIDLGLGRALGTDARTGGALRSVGSDAFPQYFPLLTTWLLDASGKAPIGDEHPLHGIHASPARPVASGALRALHLGGERRLRRPDGRRHGVRRVHRPHRRRAGDRRLPQGLPALAIPHRALGRDRADRLCRRHRRAGLARGRAAPRGQCLHAVGPPAPVPRPGQRGRVPGRARRHAGPGPGGRPLDRRRCRQRPRASGGEGPRGAAPTRSSSWPPARRWRRASARWN